MPAASRGLKESFIMKKILWLTCAVALGIQAQSPTPPPTPRPHRTISICRPETERKKAFLALVLQNAEASSAAGQPIFTPYRTTTPTLFSEQQPSSEAILRPVAIRPNITPQPARTSSPNVEPPCKRRKVAAIGEQYKTKFRNTPMLQTGHQLLTTEEHS